MSYFCEKICRQELSKIDQSDHTGNGSTLALRIVVFEDFDFVFHRFQVRAAAGGAANRLRINKPKSGMGYLQMREDGSLRSEKAPNFDF